jgi:hypothetical protein
LRRIRGPWQPGEQSLRLAQHEIDLGPRHAALDAQDHVERLEGRPRGAQHFTQAAAQPVTIYRSRHHFATDDIADAAGRLRGGRCDQLQVTRVVPRAGAENRFERADTAQAVAGIADTRRRRNERQTESLARPLARRADRTLRPPTVFILARNPCVRARRSLEGW